MKKYINLGLFLNRDFYNADTTLLLKLLELADPITFEVCMTIGRADAIAKECSLSRASYQRALKDLREQGMIVTDRGVIILTCCKEIKDSGDLPMMFQRQDSPGKRREREGRGGGLG